jgi:SAM-dependent methyltransferase
MMSDKSSPPLGPAKRAIADAARAANAERRDTEGMTLYEYPDYETYRSVQVAGNKAKLRRQFVRESHIRLLSDYLVADLKTVRFGLCHGTRSGAEQAWFRNFLGDGAEIIGTEISDNAANYPNTVQWDFHDLNPAWSGKADFVYSNSWDHAYAPEKAFGAWIDALRPGGRMLLDHGRGQMPAAANELDPFGITFERLEQFLAERFSEVGRLLDPVDTRKINREYRCRVVVFEKTA